MPLFIKSLKIDGKSGFLFLYLILCKKTLIINTKIEKAGR